MTLSNVEPVSASEKRFINANMIVRVGKPFLANLLVYEVTVQYEYRENGLLDLRFQDTGVLEYCTVIVVRVFSTLNSQYCTTQRKRVVIGSISCVLYIILCSTPVPLWWNFRTCMYR